MKKQMNVTQVTAVALGMLAANSFAQITVDPRRGDNLQRAIDLSRDGGWIRVLGGTHKPIKIVGKSLTIVGGGMKIEVTNQTTGLTQPPGIAIDNCRTVTLIDITVQGTTNGFRYAAQSPALVAKKMDFLRLVGCRLMTPQWEVVTGDARGQPGIRTSEVREIQLARSTVHAADSMWTSMGPFPNGMPGIDAPGCVVLAFGSTVQGSGNGNVDVVDCRTIVPDPRLGASGGDGIRADHVFASRCTIKPGAGAPVFCSFPNRKRLGQQPSGRPIVARTSRQTNQQAVTASALEAGRGWRLTFPPMRSGGLLFLGSLAPQSFRAGNSYLYLSLAGLLLVHPLPPATSTLTLPIPNDPGLRGLTTGVQLFSIESGSFSAPVVDAVR